MRKLDRVGTGLLALRLAVGLIFLLHGLPKLADPAEFASFFAGAGLPWPTAVVLLAGFIEAAGGLALLAGVATRSAGVVLAAEMAVAIVKARMDRGFIGGWEFELLLLAAALSLALAGPGEYTLLQTDDQPVRRGGAM